MILIDNDEMNVKNDGAYSPSLVNRVKDVDWRHCSGMTSTNRHYFTSLDRLVMIIVRKMVMSMKKHDVDDCHEDGGND